MPITRDEFYHSWLLSLPYWLRKSIATPLGWKVRDQNAKEVDKERRWVVRSPVLIRLLGALKEVVMYLETHQDRPLTGLLLNYLAKDLRYAAFLQYSKALALPAHKIADELEEGGLTGTCPEFIHSDLSERVEGLVLSRAEGLDEIKTLIEAVEHKLYSLNEEAKVCPRKRLMTA